MDGIEDGLVAPPRPEDTVAINLRLLDDWISEIHTLATRDMLSPGRPAERDLYGHAYARTTQAIGQREFDTKYPESARAGLADAMLNALVRAGYPIDVLKEVSELLQATLDHDKWTAEKTGQHNEMLELIRKRRLKP